MAGAAFIPVHSGGAAKGGKAQGKSGSHSAGAQDTEEGLGPLPKVLPSQAVLAELVSPTLCGLGIEKWCSQK